MERVKFFDGQDILIDDLTELQDRIINNIKSRALNVFSPGVINTNTNILSANNTNDTLNVAAFTAIDENGEFLSNVALTGLAPDQSSTDYPRELVVTSDGSSSWLTDVTYQVIVSYTEEDTTTVIHPVTGQFLPTRIDSPQVDASKSYKYTLYVIRKGTDTLPAGAIVLGEITYLSTTSDLDVNNVATVYLTLNGRHVTYTLPSTYSRPTTYTFGETKTLQDHVNAMGTGTPSPTNPHATSLKELGVITTVEDHETYLHSSGIVGDRTSETSALKGVIVSNNSGVDPDSFKIYGLNSANNEFLLVKGLRITPTDLPTDYAYEFWLTTYSSLTSGTYYIYYDTLLKVLNMCSSVGIGSSYGLLYNTTTTQKTVTDINVLNIDTNFSLWSITWDNTLNKITAAVDLRIFGNTGSNNLSVDSASNTFTVDHNVQVNGDLNVSGNVYGLIPIGVPVPYPGDTAPTGYVIYDGSQLVITDYQALYSILGDKFNPGTPDGIHFYVPDMRWRTIIGADPLNATGNGQLDIGDKGGFTTHTLTANELPEHTHPHTLGGYVGYDSGGSQGYAGRGTTVTTGVNVTTTDAFSVMQPYLVMNFIARAR